MKNFRCAGGFISYASDVMPGFEHVLCTVPEAAHAYDRMRKGPGICEDRGHDYSIKVPNTPNMYECFRCGEPGWEVPYASVD